MRIPTHRALLTVSEGTSMETCASMSVIYGTADAAAAGLLDTDRKGALSSASDQTSGSG
jgi:hypothetical protein